MKFAKELEDDLVPEWRAKYINYKQGKKRVKAISKALRAANKTPKLTGRPQLSHVDSTASIPFTHYDFDSRRSRKAENESGQVDGSGGRPIPRGNMEVLRRMSTTMFSTSPPIQDPVTSDDGDGDDDENGEDEDDSDESEGERTPLRRSMSRQGREDTPPSYGSFDQGTGGNPGQKMPKLSLPDPALDTERLQMPSPAGSNAGPQRSISEQNTRQVQGEEPIKPEPKKHHSQPLMKQLLQRKFGQPQHKPADSNGKPTAMDRWRKVFAAKEINSPDVTSVQQSAYQELDARQDDFFDFLDKELDKVERFYKQKEGEAESRLNVLRAQLHEHRDQRARDMRYEREGRSDQVHRDDDLTHHLQDTPLPTMPKKELRKVLPKGAFKDVFKNESKIGKTSKAMENLASPPTSPQTHVNNAQKDYTRKKPEKENSNVPHRFAKRRLKLALQEFYRGMELLKSYALLNRTGFRKINKKYDKAVNARPPLRYLNEKVSKAHFVRSTLIDEYLVAVEDLYARYFERGNRKVAVNRLRSKLRAGEHASSAFRNGLFLAGGLGLGCAGLYSASQLLFSGEQTLITSYLLQMYAGYFLALLLFLIFVLDCKIWTKARINYIFVFEYDTRHVLDWRQLAEIPCFFFFLLGLFIWINFQFGDHYAMYRYWPPLLIGLTLIIMALPFKILYYHSRKWWGVSNFRLLFAGLYPVEFRDFFLGDMYCSETYAMSQLGVFFCTYSHNFRTPQQCSSHQSKVLGFLTCLPAIWRFSQCIRRYYDSRNWFPHLANCAKYGGNILYYMTLSLYRIHVNTEYETRYRVIFIVFAAFNGLYCSLWDIGMDWSLGNIFSKHWGLRNHLAYRRKWVYWVAIWLNIVLRQQWICYAVFTNDLQHNAIMSFFVGLAEVLRRGVWVLFRVENEHQNNVKNFRASRDIPLPYKIGEDGKTSESQRVSQENGNGDMRRRHGVSEESGRGSGTGTDYDLERQTTSDSSIRRRMSNTPALAALKRVGTVIAAAHSQDFQKRRRVEVVGDSPGDETMMKDQGADSSDDDDEGHEIEGSVVGDSDGEGQAKKKGGKKVVKRRQDDEGEGSSSTSSDSQGQGEQVGDAAVHGEDDASAADRLARAYGATVGMRGGDDKKKQI